jgi:multicomponent Na+:H+ antiporter subunit D
MADVESVRPLLAVLAPVAGALLVALSSRWPNLREAWTLLTTVVTVALVASLLSSVTSGQTVSTTLFELSPGVDIALRADAAGMIFGLLASSLWVAASVYSIGYMRGLNESNQTRFYVAFALSIAAAIGVAFAANLLTFVLFYEMLTLMTYPLVTHRGTPEAIKAGRKYLAYTLSGGVALIAATAWIVSLDVDPTFRAGGILDGVTDSATLWSLFALLTLGIGVKAAVMPLHSWLPSAMVAPTPVSALLHAVAVVKAGAFGFVRVMGFVFGAALLVDMGAWQVLAGFAGVTLITGSILALRIDNLKRRLAYSTISHLSYIVLGTALLGPVGWTGALLHMVAHGVTKITLFFCAGAIHARTHKENVSELNGIGRQMPITMGAFALASLGMAGIPPFMMFGSKWLLGVGAMEIDQPVLLAWRPSSTPLRYSEASWFMVAPLSVTAALALLLGIFPDMGFKFYTLAAAVGDAVGVTP